MANSVGNYNVFCVYYTCFYRFVIYNLRYRDLYECLCVCVCVCVCVGGWVCGCGGVCVYLSIYCSIFLICISYIFVRFKNEVLKLNLNFSQRHNAQIILPEIYVSTFVEFNIRNFYGGGGGAF